MVAEALADSLAAHPTIGIPERFPDLIRELATAVSAGADGVAVLMWKSAIAVQLLETDMEPE